MRRCGLNNAAWMRSFHRDTPLRAAWTESVWVTSQPVRSVSAPRLKPPLRNPRRSICRAAWLWRRTSFAELMAAASDPMRFIDVERCPACDHGRQRFRNDEDERDMHQEKQNDCRHPQEMNQPRRVEPAEQPCQLLQLPRLPDRQAGQHHHDSGRQDAEIERLLHGVVRTGMMGKTKAQRGE